MEMVPPRPAAAGLVAVLALGTAAGIIGIARHADQLRREADRANRGKALADGNYRAAREAIQKMLNASKAVGGRTFLPSRSSHREQAEKSADVFPSRRRPAGRPPGRPPRRSPCRSRCGASAVGAQPSRCRRGEPPPGRQAVRGLGNRVPRRRRLSGRPRAHSERSWRTPALRRPIRRGTALPRGSAGNQGDARR